MRLSLLKAQAKQLGKLALLASLTLPLQANAGDDDEKTLPAWFEVEVLVFHYEKYSEDEKWLSGDELGELLERLDEKPSVRLHSKSSMDENLAESEAAPTEKPELTRQINELAELETHQRGLALRKLMPDEFKLKDQADTLRKRGGYDILYHQAWRQPVLAAKQASWINIRGGERYGDDFELEGSVRVSVQRYLHFKTDLSFTQFKRKEALQSFDFAPYAQEDNLSFTDQGEGALMLEPNIDSLEFEKDRSFLLSQSRRLRSKELHYIDSPLMGLLLLITPYELEEAPLEAVIAEPLNEIETETETSTPSQSATP